MKSRRLITSFDLLRRLRKDARRLQRFSTYTDSSTRRKTAFLRRRLEKLIRILNPLANPRLALRLAAIAFGGLAAGNLQAQVPLLLSVTPTANDVNAATSANITATFDTAMDTGTLTAGNIRIFGSQTGFLSDDGVYSGITTAIFNPDNNFKPGEKVSVSITTGVESTNGTALSTSHVFQFITAVEFGSGIFANRALSGTAGGNAATIGDFDGDGSLDVVVVRESASSLIWLNNGDGTFSETSFGSTNNSRDVVSGDLDGDGDLDVVVVNYNQANEVWLNNGDGTFTSSAFGSGRSNGVDIGDMDGDGDLDIVQVTSREQDEVWFNNGDATFSVQTFGTATASAGAVFTLHSMDTGIGDLDNDGDLDVIVTKIMAFNSYRQDIWLNDGTGTLSPQTFASSASLTHIKLADLDGDGDLDFIHTSGGTPTIYQNNGDATFASQSLALFDIREVSLGDIDGDGDLDMASAGGINGDVLLRNNGSLNIIADNIGDDTGLALLSAIGDFDNDGDLDVLFVNQISSPTLWINDPPATVVDLSPDKNAVAAGRATDVRIAFLQTMQTSTLTINAAPTHANIVVYGSQTGHLGTSATLSFEDDDEIAVITPASDFKPGELVSVTVTGASKYDGRDPKELEKALVYSFIVGADGGTGVFSSSGFGTGESTNIEFGDLDGDGDLDAIVTNYYTPNEIWLNNGDASFATSTLGTKFSSDVALGDLDGDGDLDAVISAYFAYPQEIWLNNGDGTFSSSTFGSGSSRDVALGDLDGDGDLDAVIANYYDEAEHIWFNNGDGTFTSTSLGAGDSKGVAIGDLDGDCDLDVVITNIGGADNIWLNNGGGQFVTSSFGAGDGQAVALGDLDGDGDLDAFIARSNTGNDIWKNNGDGSFSLGSLGNAVDHDVALGDLDGDGDLDAVSAVNGGAQRIWTNNGDATFTERSFGTGDSRGLAIGDLDGDGDLDVAVMNYVTNDREIWINSGTPRVTSVVPSTNANSVLQDADIQINFNAQMAATTLTTSVNIADANFIVHGMQTGHMSSNAVVTVTNSNMRAIINPALDYHAGELIMVTVTNAAVSNGLKIERPVVFSFTAQATTGSGTFVSTSIGGGNSRAAAIGDLDGDGDLDAIIGRYSNSSQIHINNGNGTFSVSGFGSVGLHLDAALGDLNGDGALDAVLVNGPSRQNEIWLNNGDGTFSSSTFGTDDGFAVDLGDLDGDGDLDAIVVTDGAFDRRWINNGDGSFVSLQPGSGVNGTRDQVAVAIGDLDNDGDLDAVTAADNNRGATIFRNNGDGTFTQSIETGFTAKGVALGDLDGDGWLDAVWAISGDVDRLRLNNGSGSLTGEVEEFGDSSSSSSVALGDLDGDGDLDMMFAKDSGGHHVFFNNGDATFISSSFAGTPSLRMAIGDLDNDDDLDFISGNGSTGRLYLNQPPSPPPPPVFYPRVTTLSPTTNANAAPVDSDIEISFSTSMNVSSLSSTNINIFGNFSGYLSTSGVLSSTNPRVFNPDADFLPGELISVTVTGAQSQAGVTASTATVYSFRAEVTNGNATFETSHFDFGFYSGLDLGDLDGDGDLDAIVAHGAFGGQRLWLNNGDGSFATSSQGDGRGTGVAMGDLDNDGDLDAMVSRAGYAEEVWLNNGDGSFGTATAGNSNGNSRGLDLGDLDGDGDLDAIVANESGQAQAIMLNNGDATFDVFTIGGSRGRDVALGDLDGDGDLDAIVAGYYSSSELMLNNGDGSFAVSSFGITRIQRTAVDVGDLDGDGDLDVVMSAYDDAHEIWFNDGTGVLTSSSFASWVSQDVQLGDLDGDGDLDAFFAANGELTEASEEGGGGDGRLPAALPGTTTHKEEMIWLNNGDGSFVSFVVGVGESSAASLGDLDGDGDLDALVVNDEGGGAPAQLWLNGAPVQLLSVAPEQHNNNVDKDADIDLVFNTAINPTTLSGSSNTNSAGISVFGSQTGNLAPAATIEFTSSTNATINPAADFKAGEKVSVTVSKPEAFTGETVANSRVQEFRAKVSRGVAIFESVSATGAGVGISDQDAGDVNGDGFVDLVYALTGSRLEVLTNNADGEIGFADSSTGFSSGAIWIKLGDLDGDGDLDVFSNGAGEQAVLFNDGAGNFSLSSVANIASLTTIELGDIDADGDLDAILAGYDSYGVLFNDGTGGFSGNSFSSPVQSQEVVLGDLDNDGDLDILVVGYYDNNRVLLNNGDGTFTAGSNAGNGVSYSAALGDLDDDGDLDAVIANTVGAHTLLNNQGNATFTTQSLPAATSSKAVVELGDMDGDGDLDIVMVYDDEPTEFCRNLGGFNFAREQLAAGDAASMNIADFDNDDDLDIAESSAALKRVWENVDAPIVTALDPNCIIETTANLSITVTGENFVETQATITILNGDGSDSGTTLSLSLLSGATSNQFQTVIPSGYVSTAGTLTLTITGRENRTTTTTLTVHPLIDIVGNICNFNGIDETYTVAPADVNAAHAWSVTNGEIVGSSSGSQVLVNWDDGAAGTLTLLRTYASGCTTATAFSVSPVGIPTVEDLAFTAVNEPVTIAVLFNDASGLSLLSVSTPDNGSAVTSGNAVVYTPDNGFVGFDSFTYTVENSEGCSVTGAVTTVVGLGTKYTHNLVWLEREKDRVGGVRGLNRAVDVAVSPDGKHLYASGRSDHSIALFNIDATSGTIEYVKRVRNGRNGVTRMRYPESLLISPDGDNLYVLSYGDNAVVVFDRNAATGDLSYVENKRNGTSDAGGTISRMKGPRSLALSDDQENLYVAGQSNNGLVVFERSTTSGTLTFMESFKDGVDGVDGLREILDVQVSPDDAHVYAAGFGEDEIAIFERSSTNGSLTFLERVRDGVDGVDGLENVAGLALSPDGNNLYAVSNGGDALVTFERSSTNGSLSFVELERDGSGGVNGLNGARDVILDSQGRELYVSGSNDDAIAGFARSATGEVCFNGASVDGVDGVDGIDRVRGLALSPDGSYIYGAGYGENSVAAFRRNYHPFAFEDTGLNVPANSSLTISVLTNDVDPDGDVLTISSKTNGSLGTVSIVNSSTKLEYNSGSSSGNDTFTYTISDGNGGSSTASVSILVLSSGRRDGVDEPGVNADIPAADVRVSPNPTAGAATVSFHVNKRSRVTARIAALTGHELWKAQLGDLNAGMHAFIWQGQDLAGQKLPSGVYYLELTLDDGSGNVQRLNTEVVIKR